MNKSVITSVSPQECELIASGRQTMLVQKTRPKIETPFKCYIYMTATKERCKFWEYITAYQNSKGEVLNGSQKVIGEFVCDRITCCQAYYGDRGEKHLTNLFGVDTSKICLSELEIFDYIIGKDKKDGIGWLWHISDLKIYDKPKELGEFYTKCEKTGDCECEDCLYLRVMLSSYPCDDDVYTWCGVDNKKPISRPPQSWVYCDPIEEE